MSGLAVGDANGGMVYDALDSPQQARDICMVLNAGISPEWEAVSAALGQLVVVKTLPESGDNGKMAVTTKTLYDTDFVAWAARTAELVRAGRLDEVDLEHVAEEIEDLGKSERNAVRSQLRRMLLHLVKQQIQPERDTASWRASIADARQEILDRLENAPSLRPYLEDQLQKTYRRAVILAEQETLVKADVPSVCPYTLDALLRD